MRSRHLLSRIAAWFGAFFLVITGLALSAGPKQKIRAAELVEKHLASIGSPEARTAVHNRVAKGAASVLLSPTRTLFPSRTQQSPTAGIAMFVSEGKSSRIYLRSSASNYRGEDLAYNGNMLRVGLVANVSSLVVDHHVLIKEGLLGGTLTTAWALLDVPGRRPRLEFNGVKQRGGREFYELRYQPRKAGGSGELRVLMYFDPLTFRHVQTEYRDQDSTARGTSSYTLTEEFADFDTVDGITLPRSYELRFARGSGIDWSVTFTHIQHNQQLDPKIFILQ